MRPSTKDSETMNIFSRIKDGLAKLLSRNDQARNLEHAPKHHKRAKFKLHYIRLRLNGGKTFRGPVFIPDAADYRVSRQTCRARLRGVFFAKISADFPNASRRQRRRVSRLGASIEYRAMMRDNTNQVAAEA